MKRKSNLVSYFIFIALIGVISSIFSSDIPFGAIIQNLNIDGTEQVLEYLSLGLAFIVFAAILAFIFIRAAGGKEATWLEKTLRDIQEDDS